jgi:hypothetical protein
MGSPTHTAALLLFVAIGSTAAIEVSKSEDTLDEGTQLLVQRKFQEFTDRATQYRKSRERTADGFLKYQLLMAAGSEPCSPDPANPCWPSMEEATSQWLSDHPGSSTAATLAGMVEMRHAEAFLHHRKTNIVPREQREQRNRHIRKSIESLLAGDQEEFMKDPAWWAARIDVARQAGEPRQAILSFFQRATDIEPLMFNLYFVTAAAMTDSTGGDAHLRKLFDASARKHKGDEDGTHFYGRMAYVLALQFGPPELLRSGYEWTRIQKSWDDIVAKYPSPGNLNRYAAMACMAGDEETLRGLVHRLGDNFDEKDWFRQKDFMEQCVEQVRGKDELALYNH